MRLSIQKQMLLALYFFFIPANLQGTELGSVSSTHS